MSARGSAQSLASVALAAAGVAGFAFVCALAVGAALVVGAKLQVPDLGADATPWSVLEAIVVVALGALGAPVDFGGIVIQVVPLGGLAAIGFGTVYALRRGSLEPRRGIGAALLVGLFFGVACWLAAAMASIEVQGEVIAARGWAAGLAGGLWGTAFALWGLLGPRRLSSLRPEARARLRPLVWFGIGCLAVAGVAGAARAAVLSPSPAAAAGTLVHGVAFAPNLAAATGSLALGARVEAGFASLAGGDAGSAPEYSLLDWGEAPTPAAAWGLLLLPALSLVAAGARVARVRDAALGALLFAVGCWALALLGEARVGLDAGARGFARLAPNATDTFVLALGWALIGLGLGHLTRRWSSRPRIKRQATR